MSPKSYDEETFHPSDLSNILLRNSCTYTQTKARGVGKTLKNGRWIVDLVCRGRCYVQDDVRETDRGSKWRGRREATDRVRIGLEDSESGQRRRRRGTNVF